MFAPALAAKACYDQRDTHSCDCRTTEAICTTRGHVWIECNSCHGPECTREHSWGCFNRDRHQCECEISEGQCDQQTNKSWTHECWSCCHHSEWGCYVRQGHQQEGCHCDVEESQCTRKWGADASWTHRCHVCRDIEKVEDAKKYEESDDKTVTWILIAVGCVLIVLVAVAIGLFFRYRWQRKEPAQQSGSTNVVVIGAPVSTEGKGNGTDF